MIGYNLEGDRLLRESYAAYWKKTEEKRVEEARRLSDWYYNDKDQITQYLREGLQKTFNVETVNALNIRVYNLVDRILSKIALSYKDPATRSLDGGVKVAVENGEAKSEQTPDDEKYQEMILSSSINRKAKEWHKLGRYFNTVLVQPRWDEKKETMDFLIHTPAWTGVEVQDDNHLIPKAFYYPVFRNINGKDEQYLVYWSEEEHFYIDRNGKRVAVPKNPGMVNPYGILPCAVLRFKDSMDFWGSGLWQIVDINEEICIQFTNLCDIAIFQTHGQAYSINMGLGGVKPEIGPRKPIVVERAGEADGQPAEFGFAQPEAAITEVRETIDWMLDTLLSINGLNPSSVTAAVRIASGVSKMMDNADIQESRHDDQSILADFEYELFEVMKAVWNYHNPNKISDDAEFAIEFADPKVVKTADEKTKEREQGVRLGTMSRVDIIMEDNPELSREEAIEKLETIVAEERQWKDKFGINDLLTDTSNSDRLEDVNLEEKE